jgi:hypothetical protein
MVTGYAARNGRPGDSCEADSRDFDGFAVEHVHASVIEDSAQELGVPRLEIMIAQDRDHRNFRGGANIGDKCLCFVGEPVFGEIAAKQQYISAAGNLGKRFVQHTARMFALMKICGCGDS